MKKSITETIICEKCGYWESTSTKKEVAQTKIYFGLCKRFPRAIQKEKKDWCGEFRLDSTK